MGASPPKYMKRAEHIKNKAMKTFVPAPFPARSCFAVAALPKGGLVEIEAIVDRIGQPF